MMTGRQVIIELGYLIDPSDVEVALVTDGRASSTSQNGVGAFTLSLASEKVEYGPGEPIDIEAELMYDGTQQTIALSGVESLVNGFGIEQLDGPLAMGPGWTCRVSVTSCGLMSQ